MNREIEKILNILKVGLESRTIYHYIKVPNPKPNTLVFHKTTYWKKFVTLQGETKLLKGKLRPKELEAIFDFLAKIVHIDNERCCFQAKRLNLIFLIAFGIFCLFLPLALFFPFGLLGIVLGVIIYLIGLTALLCFQFCM